MFEKFNAVLGDFFILATIFLIVTENDIACDFVSAYVNY